MIVSDLDPVTSICLGLASKSYYDIHRDHHKRRIDLYEQAPERGRMPLVMYLRRWAGKERALDGSTGRFVRRDREVTDGRNRNRDGEQWDMERGVKEIWGREGRLGRSRRYRRMDVGRYR